MPDNKIRLVVVGRTGSGKTSFVANASGKDMEIGQSVDSRMRDVQKATLCVNGREVILYDTPGFHGYEGRDPEIFQALSFKLATAYQRGIRINGVILMQSVSEPRVPKSERRILQLMRKVVGCANYPHIAIVTTMWDQITPAFAKRNEDNRAGGIWEEILSGGADLIQYLNTPSSAREAIERVVSKHDKFSRFTLKFQQDLVKHEGHLANTEAGAYLQAELGATLGCIHQTVNIVGETPALKETAEKIMSGRRKLLYTIVRAFALIGETSARWLKSATSQLRAPSAPHWSGNTQAGGKPLDYGSRLR